MAKFNSRTPKSSRSKVKAAAKNYSSQLSSRFNMTKMNNNFASFIAGDVGLLKKVKRSLSIGNYDISSEGYYECNTNTIGEINEVDEWTFEAEIRYRAGSSTTEFLVNKLDSNLQGWGVMITNSRLRFYVNNSPSFGTNTVDLRATANLPLDQWVKIKVHKVAGQINGSNINFYYDDVLQGRSITSNNMGTYTGSPANLVIGKRTFDPILSNIWRGLIGNIKIGTDVEVDFSDFSQSGNNLIINNKLDANFFTGVDSWSCSVMSDSMTDGKLDLNFPTLTKYPSNPVISGTSYDVTTNEYYPADIWKEGSTYYSVAKAQGNIVQFTSPDLYNWSEGNNLVPIGSNQGQTTPILRKIGSDWNLMFTRSPSSNPADRRTVWYTSSTPNGTYTKENIEIDWKSIVNPILGKNYDYADLYDVMFHNGKWIYYVVFPISNGGTNDPLCTVFESTNFMDDPQFVNVLFSYRDLKNFDQTDAVSVDNDVIQSSSAFLHTNGYFYMCLTYGRYTDVQGERRIVICRSQEKGNPYFFDYTEDTIIEVGDTGSWEERRVYGSRWIRENDGKFKTLSTIDGSHWLSYSGHDLDSGTNTGLTGLASFNF